MSREAVAGAEADLCATCGGIWIDWFDGDVRAVARTVIVEGITGRRGDPDSLRSEARAIGACPRCARQLVSERYVAKTMARSGAAVVRTATDTGAELLRCEECAGAFVSRTSAEVLAALPADLEAPKAPRASPPPPGPPPPSAANTAEKDGPLAALLRRIFGKKPG